MLKRIGPLLRCATSVLDVRLDFDRFPSTNRCIRGCEENGEEIKFNENLFSCSQDFLKLFPNSPPMIMPSFVNSNGKVWRAGRRKSRRKIFILCVYIYIYTYFSRRQVETETENFVWKLFYESARSNLIKMFLSFDKIHIFPFFRSIRCSP